MKIPRTLSLLALLLPACASTAPPGAAAPKACTTLGCSNGYAVDFQRTSWPAGRYEIELEVDGTTGKCDVELPLAASPKTACSLNDVRLEVSGSALPPDQHGLVGLAWTSRPTKVGVTVKLNGKPLGKPALLQPAYRTTQPNGPRCEPTCNGARDGVTI